MGLGTQYDRQGARDILDPPRFGRTCSRARVQGHPSPYDTMTAAREWVEHYAGLRWTQNGTSDGILFGTWACSLVVPTPPSVFIEPMTPRSGNKSPNESVYDGNGLIGFGFKYLSPS